MGSKDDEIVLQGIEIWSSICDQENSRIKFPTNEKRSMDIIKNCYPSLLQLLFKCMCNNTERTGKDWSIPTASDCCLSLVANVIGDFVVPPVLAFITANINSPNSSLRDAALLSFGSIMQGPNKQYLINIYTKSFEGVIKMLSDQSPQVRESTLFSFEKAVDGIPDFFFTDRILAQFIQI